MTDDIEEKPNLPKIYDKVGDAVEAYVKALKLLEAYFITREEAKQEALTLSGHYANLDIGSYRRDDPKTIDYGIGKIDIDDIDDKEKETLRYQFTIKAWEGLIRNTNVKEIMDRQAKEELEKSIRDGDAPEFTVDNIMNVFTSLFESSDEMYLRGIANAFGQLDRRFKSHDAFKIKNRIIITHILSGGTIQRDELNTLIDVDRVLRNVSKDQIFCGQRSLQSKIEMQTHHMICDNERWEAENRELRINGFKNGNAHLWFKNEETIKEINRLLHKFYGDVVADACEREETTGQVKSRAVSKDLAFYPTPPSAVKFLIDKMHRISEGDNILEPSAGEGDILQGLKKKEPKCSVYAIEIQPCRFEKLDALARTMSNVTTQNTNFLQVRPQETFDIVVMNPPFYGNHYMQHIYHAWNFLKPRGDLYAIVPINAELGESKQHQEFHKWIEKITNKNREQWRGYGSPFIDLPGGSFKESGTNINTLILRLHKPEL